MNNETGKLNSDADDDLLFLLKIVKILLLLIFGMFIIEARMSNQFRQNSSRNLVKNSVLPTVCKKHLSIFVDL